MTTIPNVNLPADVVAHILALPADQRRALGAYLLDAVELPDDGPPDDPDEVRRAWKDEIARRVAEVESGDYVSYTREQVEAYIDRRRAEARRR